LDELTLPREYYPALLAALSIEAVAQADEPATGTAAAEVATVSQFARDVTAA
jgi:hypothetical protein